MVHHARRITPACAGNRDSRRAYGARFEDHPRVCGEQLRIAQSATPEQGSPPRVRGTAAPDFICIAAVRITPACAGNSQYRPQKCPRFWDHPRVCGEQGHPIKLRFYHPGSPPRVRGTAYATLDDLEQAGITPACAGNSNCDCRDRKGPRDHPRVCGEQTSATKWRLRMQGSPPRVRGTAAFCGGGDGRWRITPACAGNSNICF